MAALDYSIRSIMISVKSMIAGLGGGRNPMQRLSLCAMLNDRAYINMKFIQLSLMELSGVILYPVISGPWAEPQLLFLRPLLYTSALLDVSVHCDVYHIFYKL